MILLVASRVTLLVAFFAPKCWEVVEAYEWYSVINAD